MIRWAWDDSRQRSEASEPGTDAEEKGEEKGEETAKHAPPLSGAHISTATTIPHIY